MHSSSFVYRIFLFALLTIFWGNLFQKFIPSCAREYVAIVQRLFLGDLAPLTEYLFLNLKFVNHLSYFFSSKNLNILNYLF